MRQTLFLLALSLLLVAIPDSSWARNLYLNGKLINGLRGTSFVNVTVRVDRKGDVHITGSQYKVKYKREKPPVARPQAGQTQPVAPKAVQKPALFPRPTQRYVMVGQRSVPNGSGYKITIFINGRKIRTILAQLPQDVFDPTPYLKKGPNRIEVEAIKVKPKAPGDFTLMLSEGKISKGQVKVIEPYLLQYKRSSTETKSYRHIYTVNVK